MAQILSKSLGQANLASPSLSINWILAGTAAAIALFLVLSLGRSGAGWIENTARGVLGVTPSQGFSFAA